MEAKNIKKTTNLEGWNQNTDLAVNLKTILHNDRRMQTGKEYQGVLRRDSDAEIDEFLSDDPHYTFIETLPLKEKRNPRLFDGRYITITRRPDGSLRPNFKPVKIDKGFSPYRYALEVANEIREALKGLVEEE